MMLCVLSYFIHPTAEFREYVKGWLYSVMEVPEIQPYVRRALLNIINGEDPAYNKPYWIPSKKEIRSLMSGSDTIELTITFQWGGQEVMEVPHTTLVEEVMRKLYNVKALDEFIDKYTFWIYVAVKGQSNEEDIALAKDMP